MDKYKIRFDGDVKRLSGPDYNYVFRKKDGLFIRWGKSLDDDPHFSPIGPELLDLEITTGFCSGACEFCYKANTPDKGVNMPFEVFQEIIHKIGPQLTQVAFGLTDVDANPDFTDMMKYCVEMGIVPNYTTSGYGLTPELINATARANGAVSVSVYPHTFDLAIDTIMDLLNAGVNQVNAHLLYHHDNVQYVKETIAYLNDIDGLNAIVLLSLKPIGRGSNMQPATYADMREIVSFAMSINAPLGFDSCTAGNFMHWVYEDSDMGKQEQHMMSVLAESCESSIFSAYVNVYGEFFPCSFAEQKIEPLSVLDVEDFMDIWNHPQTQEFRDKLLDNIDRYGCRRCPIYDI